MICAYCHYPLRGFILRCPICRADLHEGACATQHCYHCDWHHRGVCASLVGYECMFCVEGRLVGEGAIGG